MLSFLASHLQPNDAFVNMHWYNSYKKCAMVVNYLLMNTGLLCIKYKHVRLKCHLRKEAFIKIILTESHLFESFSVVAEWNELIHAKVHKMPRNLLFSFLRGSSERAAINDATSTRQVFRTT